MPKRRHRAYVDLFESHETSMREKAERRKLLVGVKSIVQKPVAQLQAKDLRDCVHFERKDCDAFLGCSRIRTIHALLSIIDDRGFERSQNQEKFHDAFIRSSAPIIYREEWSVHQQNILHVNRWDTIMRGMLVSTPRRFGKTFSIAMFCVVITLTFQCEVVVFSPARRASRKILERMYEFVTLLGMEHRIEEYNMENLRLRPLEGGSSLIRSFPSKVSVRSTPSNPLEPDRTHSNPKECVMKEMRSFEGTEIANKNVLEQWTEADFDSVALNVGVSKNHREGERRHPVAVYKPRVDGSAIHSTVVCQLSSDDH